MARVEQTLGGGTTRSGRPIMGFHVDSLQRTLAW